MGLKSTLARQGRKIKKIVKPKFKAKRTLDTDVEKELKEQSSVSRASPKKRKGRAFEQTQAEKAADKTPKTKKDTRAERAGANVTGAQKNAIKKAPSTQALTSLKSKLNKEVDALKNATDDEKKTRKSKIATMIDDAKETIRKKSKDAAKPKPKDTRPASKKPQSAKERQEAAIGKSRTPRKAPASDRKPSMAMMTSYTSMKRADAIVKAGRDLREGKITESEFKSIMRAIDATDQIESVLNAARRTGSKKPVTLSQMVKGKADKDLREGGMLKKPTPDQKGLKKLPTPVRNKMGFIKRGGMMKVEKMDMRKGGMFYK
mgnify:CR=1 FL=1